MPAFQRSASLACGFTTPGHSDTITLPMRATSVKVVSTVVAMDLDTTFAVSLSVLIGQRWIPVAAIPEQTSAGTESVVAHLRDMDGGDSPQVRVDWTLTGGSVRDAMLTVVG